MANRKEETASFMLRFTQKIYDGTDGAHEVQWRGNIRHVQSGTENKFVEVEDALAFIQSNLAELTKQSIVDKTPEEQKGILSKSFGIWKKVASEAPKLVMDTLRDPMKQAEYVQEQIQDRIGTVKDELGKKLDIDNMLGALGHGNDKVLDRLEAISNEIAQLNIKVDKLQKSKK